MKRLFIALLFIVSITTLKAQAPLDYRWTPIRCGFSTQDAVTQDAVYNQIVADDEQVVEFDLTGQTGNWCYRMKVQCKPKPKTPQPSPLPFIKNKFAKVTLSNCGSDYAAVKAEFEYNKQNVPATAFITYEYLTVPITPPGGGDETGHFYCYVIKYTTP